MTWNWEQPDWPNFTYNSKALEPLERQFLRQSGEFVGAYKHIGADDQETLKIELISEEAVKTSEIEGEILNRDSVQSSLRAQLGLGAEAPNVKPAERGISKMMIDLYRGYADPLTDQTMFDVAQDAAGRRQRHQGHRRLSDAPRCDAGRLRSRPQAHGPFRGPAFRARAREMKRLITWFNDTAPSGRDSAASADARRPRASLLRVHPSVRRRERPHRPRARRKIASPRNLGQPSLIALAYTIERKHKDYYAALERNNKGLRVDGWMMYFANTVLQAQDNTIKRVDFYIAKAKFYEKFRDKLNERQSKVIARVFREGIDGFKGGLSAENYIGISRPRARPRRATCKTSLRKARSPRPESCGIHGIS